jgi:hypothetical protein
LGVHQGWGNAVEDIAIAGRFACLARGLSGLQVLELTDPAHINWVTGRSELTANAVAATPPYVVVAGGAAGLQVFELEQRLHPGLRLPVISGETITLTWPPFDGVRLQWCPDLEQMNWQDVAGTQGASAVTLPASQGRGFFRLTIPQD